MSRPVRIASLTTSLHIGGDENRLLTFARSVDRSRFEHVVLVVVGPSRRRDELYGPMLERFRESGIAVESLGEELRREGRPRRGRARRLVHDSFVGSRIVRRLVQFLRAKEIDVLDTRMAYAILLGVLAGRLAGTPAIVATEYQPEFWGSPLLYTAGRFCLSRVDALVGDSRASLENYQRWFRMHHRRAVVIPNGVFPPTSARTREEMRRALGLPADPAIRVIGQIGRLLPLKGQHVLLETARRLLSRESSVALLICGYSHPDPGYGDELRRRAEQMGIGDRVRIVSYPGPIGDVWAAVDLHVHASLQDSSPITIHESMALGLPAVVTRVGGIPELVLDGETGLIVPPDDPDALARALARLLNDREEARRLGNAARERYLARHRPEHMAETLGLLFEDLVERSARRRGGVHAVL